MWSDTLKKSLRKDISTGTSINTTVGFSTDGVATPLPPDDDGGV